MGRLVTQFNTFYSKTIILSISQKLIHSFGKGAMGKLSTALVTASARFAANPISYLCIPVVAALIGWFTNWLAVQMLFYPIQYRGINLVRRPEVPLGFLGWQGVVPCKTRKMTTVMVEMVTTQLLNVKEVFGRLDPRRVASLLEPEVAALTESLVADILPSSVAAYPRAAFLGLPAKSKEMIAHLNRKFLIGFTRDMQNNIDQLLSVESCVLKQMLADRSLLGQLFKNTGQAELNFLTNSGVWFGFLLGIIQMIVALFWTNPWALSIGGTIVGYATNWLALKWIFEPVNPTKIGPFILQGQFLRRQKEVSLAFSKFFSQNILRSEKLWHSILTDPKTSPIFNNLFAKHMSKFIVLVTTGLGLRPEPEMISKATTMAIQKLPNHIGVLHKYVDDNLGLENTLRVQMEKMSSEQFERVLHPIFEEDELILILAGAVLGLIAGLIQQGFATGKLKFPTRNEIFCSVQNMDRKLRCIGTNAFQRLGRTKTRLKNMIYKNGKRPKN